MTVYGIIYLILALALVLFSLRHRLDLLYVCANCYVMYTIYCIFGYGLSGAYYPTLSAKLYMCVYMQMAIILAFTWMYRHSIRGTIGEKSYNSNTSSRKISLGNFVIGDIVTVSFEIYLIIMLLFAIINIAGIGFSGLAEGKANVWEQTNVFYVISLYGAYPAFAFGLHTNNKKIWVPAVLIELTIFFAGSRAFFTTMIIIFLCEKGSELWRNRKSNLRLLIIGVIGIVFLLVYRAVDQSIMAGDFRAVATTLSNPATWLEALEFNEPRVIIANYDYIVSHNIRLPLDDMLFRIIDFLPGATKIIPFSLSYNEYFSEVLRSLVGAVRGVGGSFWGESYAMFGIFGVPFMTLIWLFFVRWGNSHLSYRDESSYFIVSVCAYLSWYINRLDYNLVGQACKVMLFCYMIWAVIFLLLGGEVKIFKLKIRLSRLSNSAK